MSSMNTLRKRGFVAALAAGTSLGFSASPASAGGKTCVQDGADTTKVCVEWSLVADPDEITDFTVNFADASNPDIELITGNLGWIVSSEVVSSGNPANIGDLSLAPDDLADDFEVKIANGSGAGAADVGSIILTATSFTGYSLLEGGSISGDLTGDLTLVSDSGGTGGTSSGFTIDGAAKGNITMEDGAGFTIGGAYAPGTISEKIDVAGITSGTMKIGSVAAQRIDAGAMSGGILQIDGDIDGVGVAPQCTFYITSMVSSSSLRGAYTQTAGSLTIEAAVILSGDLASGCTIDFSNAKLANASISMGPLGQYDLVGDLLVYEWLSSSVFLGDDISGDVTITSDFAPQSFLLKGDLSPAGTIDIGGDFTSGTIDVEGDILGDILVASDMDGDVNTDGKLGSPPAASSSTGWVPGTSPSVPKR